MMRHFLKLFFLLAVLLLLNCATTKTITLHEQQAGKSLLVGAVLVENDGLEDVYEAKTSNITVVIVGKSLENGKEVTKAYRVKTNPDGYYMVQNVPPGAYVIKGIEVDLGYETHMIISSRWDGNTQSYYPESLMIDSNVRVWPPASDQKIIDMQIRYFKIDAAQRIAYDNIKSLKDAVLSIRDNRYTMPNPFNYFRTKYPDWSWFQAD